LQASLTTGGAAITVGADNVEVDLKGFTLAGSGGTGVGTREPHRGVVVRNGRLRGFSLAADVSGEGARIDDLQAESGTIRVSGEDAVVRGCRVSGSTGYGIQVKGGRARVLRNHVLATGTSPAGILVEGADGAVIGRNDLDGGLVGILVSASADVLVESNRITRALTGIRFETTPGSAGKGKYQGNLTSGVAIPYAGGTDAGGNE
jgi:nitrous oxidase accessory protein NosD